MCKKSTCLMYLGLLMAVALSSAARGELVGWWKLDETSGTTVADSSGKGNNGTVQGTGAWVAGHLGGAWQGNGTNAYIQIPHSESLNVGNAVTVALWLNMAGSVNYQIIEKGGTDGNAWKYSYGFRTETSRQMRANWDGSGFYSGTNGVVPLNTWTHVAITFDPAGGANNWKWYINGVVTNQTTWAGPLRTNTNNIVLGRDNYSPTRWYFNGMMDDVRVYNEALPVEKIAVAMAGGGLNPGAATSPVPANKATDVPSDTVLGWKPGQFPGTHNVYFGTSFADVNAANAATLVSQGQDANTYDPPGVLAYGQTYYWRVDEVNTTADHSVFRGEVWSFTAEAVSYPIPGVTASASSFDTGKGPENTVNGSGLDSTGLLHSTTETAMWLSAPSGSQPTWIQYDFDRVYKVTEMWVWNYNGDHEQLLGFGVKNATIQYKATDEADWTTLGNVDFNRGSAAAAYAHDTPVPFGGVAVKQVRITVNSSFGTSGQYGLSEVRFYYKPVAAREPQPTDGKTGVSPDVTLTWRPGREAVSHKVYLGTDPNVLTLTDTVTTNSYTPAGLNLGTKYYWRIDEVNTAESISTWAGQVWSFTVADSVVVDDMESYTNTDGNRIYQFWADGYDTPTTNGSVVGYTTGTSYVETTIINGGKQSMPFSYTNTVSVTNSEATRTFADAQDWTQHGIKGLSLFFYGDPTNSAVLPYVKINGTKVVYSGKAEDVKRSQWQPWNVDLSKVAASTLKSVTKLAIGVDGASVSGKLLIDDIRLYPLVGELVTPADPGTTGLLAWYKFEGDFKDSAGTFNGTALGDAKIVSDPIRGQVVSLDGTGDAVDVPLLGSGTTLTISLWANTSVDPVPIQYAGFFHCDGWEAADIHWRYSYGKINSGINGVTGDLTGKSIARANQWNHVAVTVSATEWTLWLNGLKDGSRTLTAPATVTLGDGLIGAWLGADGTTISRGFTGMIDDVRFYNRALSQAEVGWLAGRTEPFAKPL